MQNAPQSYCVAQCTLPCWFGWISFFIITKHHIIRHQNGSEILNNTTVANSLTSFHFFILHFSFDLAFCCDEKTHFAYISSISFALTIHMLYRSHNFYKIRKKFKFLFHFFFEKKKLNDFWWNPYLSIFLLGYDQIIVILTVESRLLEISFFLLLLHISTIDDGYILELRSSSKMPLILRAFNSFLIFSVACRIRSFVHQSEKIALFLQKYNCSFFVYSTRQHVRRFEIITLFIYCFSIGNKQTKINNQEILQNVKIYEKIQIYIAMNWLHCMTNSFSLFCDMRFCNLKKI